MRAHRGRTGRSAPVLIVAVALVPIACAGHSGPRSGAPGASGAPDAAIADGAGRTPDAGDAAEAGLDAPPGSSIDAAEAGPDAGADAAHPLCGAAEDPCQTPADCCPSLFCNSGQCGACIWPGGDCGPTDTCCGGEACIGGTCTGCCMGEFCDSTNCCGAVMTTSYNDVCLGCAGAGDPCTTDASAPCCTHTTNPLTCVAGTCQTVCRLLGEACATADDCCFGACKNGSCVCPASAPTTCEGRCTDAHTDPRNCGTCGNACASPQECVAGECVSW